MVVGDLFKIVKGKQAEESINNSFERYIQIEDLRSANELKYAVPNSKNIVCNENDILIAWDGANAGTVGYNLNGVIGSTIAKLSPKNSNVYSPYAGKFLQSKFKYLRRNCTGATIPHISKPILEILEIPLPPLPQQKKIAAILDAADEYRQKTKALIAKYDELAQSLFIEMFGDPMKNPKGWKEATVEAVCTNIYGGGTPSKSHPEYYIGNIPWVTPKDMKSEYIIDSIDHVNQLGIDNSSTRLIPSGNVLMVIRSGILKHTLPVAINTRDVTINQDMKAFIPNLTLTNAFYMKVFFHCSSRSLLGKVRAVTADNIEFRQIQELKYPLPTIQLQNQFADRCGLIESQKAKAQQSLYKAEELFNSLLQRAFKGDLVN